MTGRGSGGKIALTIRQNTTPYVSLRDGATISANEIADQILVLTKEALPELAKEAGYQLEIDANAQLEYFSECFENLARNRGYVKLAEDQTVDIPDEIFFSQEARRCGFTKRSFSEAGWQKVERS